MPAVLKRITYEDTAASIIEFIATKEAVHPMKSLEDLRSRLGPGRRVFALFHPLLPDKPLVFVHVALKEDTPSSMLQVMEASKMDQPKVATFYSISNSQPGLAGVGLGEYLLKESIAVRNVWSLDLQFRFCRPQMNPFFFPWTPVAANGVFFT